MSVSIDTVILIVIACELGFIYVRMANKDQFVGLMGIQWAVVFCSLSRFFFAYKPSMGKQSIILIVPKVVAVYWLLQRRNNDD